MHVGQAQYCANCGHRLEPPVSRRLDIAAKPAREFHQSQRTATLDLRSASPKPVPVRPVAKTPAAAPASTAKQRQSAANQARLQAAKAVERSPHIQRFPRPTVVRTASVPEQPVEPTNPSAVRQMPQADAINPKRSSVAPEGNLPGAAVTHHESLVKLAKTKPSRPRYQFVPQPARVLTVLASILIMGGYVWLQNSPKLALQSANSQAGITASLPGYLPSSYNLADTDTGPGLVSLGFKSPSIPEILKINQHKTSWDSASLLENFVTKQADDYSTIQGQGLTIFVFGQNRAAWVNHGIWYNIEGATHLSREQLLKIAFSL